MGVSYEQGTPVLDLGLIAAAHAPLLHRNPLRQTPRPWHTLQGYLAHKKTPTPPGPPKDPRHRPTVGSEGGAFPYERGTPVNPQPSPHSPPTVLMILSCKFGTNKTVKARFWPRLEPFPCKHLRRGCSLLVRRVDVRLPGKGNSNSLGARPVHLIITMIEWIRNSRLSIKNSPSGQSKWVPRNYTNIQLAPRS